MIPNFNLRKITNMCDLVFSLSEGEFFNPLSKEKLFTS